MSQKVIGICGLIGSGKDTVSNILVNDHGFKKLSFADKLKDAVSVIFDWDRSLIEGDTKESRRWREEPDEFWTTETGTEITPRLILQLFGTECMRNGFHDNIWVSIVKKTILENPNTNFVISDTRFKNEIEMIQSLNGQIWQVRRGELPAWWNTAILTNTVEPDDVWIYYDNEQLMENKYPDIHASEWHWVNTDDKFDAIINNEGTLEDLVSLVNLLQARI